MQEVLQETVEEQEGDFGTLRPTRRRIAFLQEALRISRKLRSAAALMVYPTVEYVRMPANFPERNT